VQRVLLDHLINGFFLARAAARALRPSRPRPAQDASEVLVQQQAAPAGLALEPVDLDTPLQFACHPGVPCFNQCCADMRIALPPYDVLRLRRGLGLGSRAFLDQHTDLQSTTSGLPLVLLRLGGDGDRCPWVSARGCGVYLHRPTVCRLFPLGRSAYLDASGQLQQRLVLQRMPICKGFEEVRPCTPRQWLEEQELAPYLAQGDRHAELVRHVMRREVVLPPRQAELVLSALYDLDRFRELVEERGLLLRLRVRSAERQAIRRDDEALLRFGFAWVEDMLRMPGR
jgi:Fe-S-cluster containining protein